MKRFLFVLCVMIIGQIARAQISSNDLFIQGYVLASDQSNDAVPYHPVEVYSAENFAFIDIIYTDQNGFYSITIPNGSVSGPNQEFYLFSYSCDSTEVFVDSASSNLGTVDSIFTNIYVTCGTVNSNCSAPISMWASESAQFQFSTLDVPGLIATYNWTVQAYDVNGFPLGQPINSSASSVWYNTLPPNVPSSIFVCLQATFNDGCVTSTCEIFDYCSAQMEYTVNSNNSVNLTAVSPALTTSNFLWTVNGPGIINPTQQGHDISFVGEPGASYLVCLTMSNGFGCNVSQCDTITIPVPPTCNAGYQILQVQDVPGQGTLIQFSSLYGGWEPDVIHNWTFSNNTVQQGANLALIFNPGDVITACHQVWLADSSCYDEYCESFTVIDFAPTDSCDANFTFTYDPLSGLSLLPTGTNAPGTQYNWVIVTTDFQGISYTYQDTANFPWFSLPDSLSNIAMCLTVTNPFTGCSEQICQNNEPCQVNLNVLDLNGVLAISNSNGTNAGDAYTWEVYRNGNYEVYSGPNLNLPYAPGEQILVCLSLVNTITGCQAFACDTINTNGGSGECSAEFTYYIDPQDGNIVAFTPTNVIEGQVYTQWYFGTEGSTDQFNPVGYFPNGTYVVCLYVWDNNGCSSYTCDTITINGDSTNSYCQAYFSAVNNGTTVSFQNWSYAYPELPAGTYFWDFGDGSTSDEVSPTHTYSVEGWYTVTLTMVTNSCESTYINYVYAGGENSDCNATFNMYQLSDVPPYQIQFVSNSTGFSDQYYHYWTLSDGQVSYDANPFFILPTPGNYTVCHTVTDLLTTCDNSICYTFDIWGIDSLGCSAYFTASNDAAQPGYVSFTPYVANPAYSYEWLIEGVVYTDMFPGYTFNTAGYQEVCLTVYGNNGCFDTYCNSFYIGDAQLGMMNIWGNVFAGANLADIGTAYLIAADSLTGDMVTIAETPISQGSYYFSNVAEGTYYIRAELSTESPYYSNYVPTYFGSQYYWELAEPINLTASTVSPYGYVIALIYAGNSGGPGLVGGMVDEGPTRLMSPEASGSLEGPVSGANVIVTDLFGNPQRWVKSNAEGGFAIQNLNYGTYRLLADVAGMPCVPVEFTISPDYPNLNITLTMGDGVTSVAEVTAGEFITEPFPNPARETSMIKVSRMESGMVNFEIQNLAGQVVAQTRQNVSAGVQTIELPLSGIASGAYLVRVSDETGKVMGVRKLTVTP